MKKICILFLFVSLLLVGCTSATESIDKAYNKMKGLENFTTGYLIETTGNSSNNQKMKIDSYLNGKTDLKSKQSSFTLSVMSGNSKGMSVNMYSDENNNQFTLYMEGSLSKSGWSKNINSDDQKEVKINTIPLLDIVNKTTNVKKSFYKENNMEKYRLTISNKDMKEIIADIVERAGDDLESELEVKDKGSTTVSLYVTNEGYIGKVIINLADYIKDKGDKQFIESIVATITYSKFNKSNVTIPTDVINKAVLYESNFFN